MSYLVQDLRPDTREWTTIATNDDIQLAAELVTSRHRRLVDAQTGAVVELLPIDPMLSIDFDQTANELRSTEELDLWWDKPFARWLEGGGLEVRCLDGGAWDRSTWYGHATNMAEAAAIATAKLAKWQERRLHPMPMLDVDDIKIVRMPQRPDQPMQVLESVSDQQKVAEALKRHMP
jgi:hypothetical protein